VSRVIIFVLPGLVAVATDVQAQDSPVGRLAAVVPSAGTLHVLDGFDGSLNRIDWRDGPRPNVPVGGSAAPVSGRAVDGQDWSARTRFRFQDGNGRNAGQAPVATWTSTVAR